MNNIVSLNQVRENGKSSVIGGDTWLISGGDATAAGITTEIWNGAEFVPGPDLSEDMYGHCQVTIDSTHVFFGDCEDRTAYILDWEARKWTQYESMSTSRDHYCGCGLINNEVMGKEVVVAGYGTSEIFNLETFSWRDGPELPYGFGYASVQLDDTFLLAGGYEEDYTDKIYIFHPENYEFVLKTQKLQYPRRYAGAVAVNDYLQYINCTKI